MQLWFAFYMSAGAHGWWFAVKHALAPSKFCDISAYQHDNVTQEHMSKG